jgi:hypothetical protein
MMFQFAARRKNYSACEKFCSLGGNELVIERLKDLNACPHEKIELDSAFIAAARLVSL